MCPSLAVWCFPIYLVSLVIYTTSDIFLSLLHGGASTRSPSTVVILTHSLPSWDYLWQARDESGQAKVDEDIVDEQRQGYFKWQPDPALSIDRQIHALSTLLVTSTITQ